MAWSGNPGSGNLLMGSADRFAVGIASLVNLGGIQSLAVASGVIVQTAANVGGSAAAIVGRPDLYVQFSYCGTDYLFPIYRKV